MQQGTIFDIQEFSVHDGPGIRQTVFFKGCPMRCKWCHNPEGWNSYPQLLIRHRNCIHCGACKQTCTSQSCTACGRCIPVCPVRSRWICGETITSSALAERLLVNADIYADMGGGTTFSGGEPLMQPDFLFETATLLSRMHLTLETCGYADSSIFDAATNTFDLIMMDVKLTDSEQHRFYTGQGNECILKNLKLLCYGSTPFIIRIPLIPGITDTENNIRKTAKLLQHAKALQYVELLPYNRMAGAKYEWLGLTYQPMFDVERPVVFRHGIFQEYGIESRGK